MSLHKCKNIYFEINKVVEHHYITILYIFVFLMCDSAYRFDNSRILSSVTADIKSPI